MSNFTKDEQTKVVKKALELEEIIIDCGNLIEELKQERFEEEPEPPEKMEAVGDYSSLPAVNLSFDEYLKDDVATNRSVLNVVFADHPFIRALIIDLILVVLGILFLNILALSTIILLLSFVPVPAAAYYWYTKRRAYNAKVAQLNSELPQTPEYIAAKAEIDKEVESLQQELDARYAKEKAEYDNVVLPRYKKAFATWTAEHNGKVDGVLAKLNSAIEEQTQLYESTKIIPMQYRDIDALTYIYGLMSTSDYSIKEAIDMYDKAIQREQEYTRNVEMSRQNTLLEEQNYHLNQQNALAEEQNYLLEEQNVISEKARREASLRGALTAVQNRNTNKYLKELTKKFDK